MRLTDPEVIKHLEENYYIRRESKKDKCVGYYFDGRGIIFVCPPFEMSTGFSFEDIKATDWILCPKE